jgi:CheY-like chemotaxis protein
MESDPIAPKSVLVVENEPLARSALVTLLQRAGYAVSGAADGGEAVEHAKGLLSPPNLILLDLLMPGVDGWHFRREQVLDPDLAGIPLVVCSGAEDASLHARSLGAAACLEKPVDPNELLDVVRRLLT